MQNDVQRLSFLTFRRVAALVGVAVFMAACVFFVADNFVLIDVRFFTFFVQMRLAWLVLITFLVGVGSGVVLSWLWRRRRG